MEEGEDEQDKIEKKAEKIRAWKMNKRCSLCSCHFLTNSIRYNQALEEWEHLNCQSIVIKEPTKVSILRGMVRKTLPKSSGRMLAPSSGRQPRFYLLRVEKQKSIDAVLYSLADFDDDFIIENSFLV